MVVSYQSSIWDRFIVTCENDGEIQSQKLFAYIVKYLAEFGI